jgi:hypothetical protein
VLVCFVLAPQAQAVCREGCLFNAGTFLGDDALVNNTTGTSNTAIGASALTSNTDGSFNTATGFEALSSNTNGLWNTANGYQALDFNTTGSKNTALGRGALYNNTTANGNTAIGYLSLNNNTTGPFNTANGNHSLYKNTIGVGNTAIGQSALFNNTTGFDNIAVGFNAGANLTAGGLNIYIGNPGVASEGNTIRIGTSGKQTTFTYIAGISGAAVAGGVGVLIDTDGHLGTAVSSERFKENVKPMDKASEAVLALKPVTFRYKHDLDPAGIPQFGLVAEDVEKVNPDLVARDEQGKPYTVRYEAVNAMLLNEFLKEHRKVEALEKAMAEQQKENAAMRAMLKEQAAQIQKVNAQLEMSTSVLQPVVNNQ